VFREQFGDALGSVISDQDRAGLDIVTTGDYQCDDDFFGRSWANYVLERVTGFGPEEPPSRARWDLDVEHPPGTLLHEILGEWLTPRVVGAISDEGSKLEYGHVWRLAQSRSRKPVKFGAISAQALAGLVEIETPIYADDRRQMLWDLATATNAALRELVAGGCKVIQLEEPNFHFGTAHMDRTDTDFLVDAFNHEVDGLGEAEIWVHTCFGNPNMQRVFRDTHYAQDALSIYLERLNCDVLTVEMKDRGYADMDSVAAILGSSERKVAVGVVSHRTLQVESPEEVAADVRKLLEKMPPEQLVLTSDCGFGRQGCTRSIALYKAASIAQGANIVRRELGVEERPVPIADPALQAHGALA
jgi:5-methyltetrahydropteroyltriglutamate--homocysteine methyltransferase